MNDDDFSSHIYAFNGCVYKDLIYVYTASIGHDLMVSCGDMI